VTSPLDRAARAIEAADEDELLPPLAMGVQRKFALAALATTRETTVAMSLAGHYYLAQYPKGGANQNELWRVMHAALMKE
jgi:hypothetical protein